MPRIQWTNLPPPLRDHLFERLAERQITVEDIYKLKLWRESEPEAPEGLWYKDLARSNSVAKVSFQRHFCSETKPQRARRWTDGDSRPVGSG